MRFNTLVLLVSLTLAGTVCTQSSKSQYIKEQNNHEPPVATYEAPTETYDAPAPVYRPPVNTSSSPFSYKRK